MKEKRKNLKEHKDISKWLKRDNLIVIILSGILLMVIALPTGEKRKAEENTNEKQKVEGAEKMAEETGGLQAAETEYEAMLEKRLKQMLEGMSGAGRVEVMITLASSRELVVEKDRPVTRSNTTEEDGEGGTRTIYETDNDETTIYRGEGTDSEPYVVKTLMPEVEGVLVAAQGAGTGEVTKNITEAVQALFGLDAHKVKVIRLKSSQ